MAEAYTAAHGGMHAAEEDLGTPLTRRELLNYVWLGSLGVFVAQLGGATVLFALPRFKEGEFGGVFSVGETESLPGTDAPPLAYNDGKFWLVNTEDGLLALYRVCTHLGCLFAWQDSENKFICPCHGSQFQRAGQYIQGPAPRSLDAFNVIVTDANGQEVASTRAQAEPGGVHSYVPVPVEPGQLVVVDTGDLIQSSGHEDGYVG